MSHGDLLTVGHLIQPFRCLLMCFYGWWSHHWAHVCDTYSLCLFSICTSFLGTAIHNFPTKAFYNDNERGFYYLYRWNGYLKAPGSFDISVSLSCYISHFLASWAEALFQKCMLCNKSAYVFGQWCSEQKHRAACMSSSSGPSFCSAVAFPNECLHSIY